MNATVKLALVTGAGSGLGAAMAAVLAREGYGVWVTDSDADRARAQARKLTDEGLVAWPLELDVTADEHWRGARAAVGDRRLDVLINNAGVAVGGSLEDTPMEDWQWVMAINLMGVVRGCKTFAPVMREQGGGHIVNVASFAGLAGAPEINAYGVSKAGVIALSEQMRAELGPAGVGVSVLCPAFVQTNLMDSFRSHDPRQKEQVKRWMAGSGVTPEHVATAVMRAIRRNRFLVLTHRDTRWSWRFKRHFPGLYRRMIDRLARRMHARNAA